MRNATLILIALLATGQCFAQPGEEKESHKHKPEFSPSFAIKWNPASLFLGKVGLFGEYNFKHKKSITLAVGIPYDKETTYKLDDKDRSISTKTFSVMGGYRMYLGKKNMTGFYFEPYVKYLKNDASTIVDGDLNGRDVDFILTSHYTGIGLGLQLGMQYMIAKRVVFDIFFLGPEANSSHHQAAMHDITSTTPWNASDAADAQNQINDNLGDIPILGNKLKVTVDPNARTVSSDYQGFLPGLRMGMSIGIRLGK